MDLKLRSIKFNGEGPIGTGSKSPQVLQPAASSRGAARPLTPASDTQRRARDICSHDDGETKMGDDEVMSKTKE